MKSLNLPDGVTAMCEELGNGSEVLLFRRNEGFLGRLFVAETGVALQRRLELSVKLNAKLVAQPS